MSGEENKALISARQRAVRQAWKQERERVREGRGTRDWTPQEQKEILERGALAGYEGHHMKCVSQFPAYADDPDNIQFLTEDEHIQGAHQGSYHNPTNGYYDPDSGEMHRFSAGSLEPPPERELSRKAVLEQDAPSAGRGEDEGLARDARDRTGPSRSTGAEQTADEGYDPS